MTVSRQTSLSYAARFGLLASAVAGIPINVEVSATGPWTDGRTIYVVPTIEVRPQVLVQAALIGAGSLRPEVMRPLRGRAATARRYVLLEGRRSLSELRSMLPPDACPDPGPPAGAPRSDSPETSLEIARSKVHLPDPPSYFGVLRPRQVLVRGRTQHSPGRANEMIAAVLRTLDVPGDDAIDRDDDDDDGDGDGDDNRSAGTARGYRLWQLFRSPAHRFWPTRSVRRTQRAHDPGVPAEDEVAIGRTAKRPRLGADSAVAFDLGHGRDAAAPAPGPRPALTVYPEWDEQLHTYRPDWCTVLETTPLADELMPLDRSPRHDGLRNQLAQLRRGLERRRRRPTGHDFDIDAAIESQTAVFAGGPSADSVYIDNVRCHRDLGVLVLLDASGSGNDTSPYGGTVHERQRDAAAALVDTLSNVGDRVAAYAFRSWGRSAVTYTVLKSFDEPFGAESRARIGGIETAGFTRFGAAIRHSAHILSTQSGTPSRLLVVISDGFPFDDDYEGDYAEADIRKALAETRTIGVGTACINVGSEPPPEALSRLYGATTHATASGIDALSPHILRVFHTAITDAERERRDTYRASRRAA